MLRRAGTRCSSRSMAVLPTTRTCQATTSASALNTNPTNTIYHWLLDGGNGNLVKAGTSVKVPCAGLGRRAAGESGQSGRRSGGGAGAAARELGNNWAMQSGPKFSPRSSSTRTPSI